MHDDDPASRYDALIARLRRTDSATPRAIRHAFDYGRRMVVLETGEGARHGLDYFPLRKCISPQSVSRLAAGSPALAAMSQPDA